MARVEGKVRSVDSRGNLVTDIRADSLAGAPTGEELKISCEEHVTYGLFRGYEEQPELTLLAVMDDRGVLELGIVGESAHAMLGVKEGAEVTVEW